MKATQYEGDKTFSVVEKEIEQPIAGEVRIKVAYVGVCGTDVHIYHGMMDQRVSMPLTIGHEMSGVIDAVGAGVTGYSVGEKVVVRPLDDRGVKPSDKGFDKSTFVSLCYKDTIEDKSYNKCEIARLIIKFKWKKDNQKWWALQ